jgi:hypothetical protein
VNPTARPPLPHNPAPWLLGPAEIAAIRADNALINRLAGGERPDSHDPDPDPVASALAAWLHEVEIGGAR